MKIDYVILEDEPLAAERLKKNLTSLRSNWQCLGVIQSVRDAAKRLPKLNPQLLFVDIHLADDISFSLFSQIDIQAPIIFTTAYDQYAIKAFKLNSIDYLLKPIDETELLVALQKFEEQKLYKGNLAQLLSHMQPDYKTRFLVSTGLKIKTIEERDIAYFFASGKHSYLIHNNGTEYLFNQPLSKLIEQLNPSLFFQINRQYILSIWSIKEMIPYSKGRLKVITHPATADDTIVSVDKSNGFKAWVGGN